jgi:hypothetical protein
MCNHVAHATATNLSDLRDQATSKRKCFVKIYDSRCSQSRSDRPQSSRPCNRLGVHVHPRPGATRTLTGRPRQSWPVKVRTRGPPQRRPHRVRTRLLHDRSRSKLFSLSENNLLRCRPSRRSHWLEPWVTTRSVTQPELGEGNGQ